MELAWKYPLLAGAGMLAGFIDSIAGGGGLITLPSLLWAGVPPQLALGTNKLQSSCGTSLATWRYHQAGLLAAPHVATGVGVTFLAAIAGSAAAVHAPTELLRRLIPVLLVVIGLYIGLRPAMGSTARQPRMTPVGFALVWGTVLGFYDGFFGPGTGSFWTTACVGLLGMEFRAATGYTKAMNLASNLASVLFFALSGKVDYGLGAVMAAGQLVGAQAGSRLVIHRGASIVRPALLAVVLLLAAKLIRDAYFAH